MSTNANDICSLKWLAPHPEFEGGEDGADEAFCHSARACIKLVTAHIQEEESEFYPAAEQLLGEREHHELRNTCRRLEEEMDRQGFDRMMATLRRLKVAYPGSG